MDNSLKDEMIVTKSKETEKEVFTLKILQFQEELLTMKSFYVLRVKIVS